MSNILFTFAANRFTFNRPRTIDLRYVMENKNTNSFFHNALLEM